VNVLFLTHAFPRTVEDAAGSFVLRLAVALRHEGIMTTVLAPNARGLAERERLQEIEVRRFRYAPEALETLAYTGTMAEQVQRSWTARAALVGLIASAARAATRTAKELRPALLHAHWWFPNALAALPASMLRRLPLVTTLHGSDVRLARQIRGARALYRQVAARSSIVSAVSGWLAAQASELAPNAPPPRVAPMPADVGLFTPGGRRATDRLLFVGRLTRQKGVDLLLRALTETPADVSADIIGDGPEADVLRQLAASLGVSTRVRWHPPMPQVRLVDFYRAATSLVVPSIDEGLGLVAVEAQLCETPVVAFDSGGLRDIVVEGETGLLVRPRSPSALAAAVTDLLRRADRGASLGKAGRARALELFSPDAAARRYVGIYQEAISHFHRQQS
jgi:glycosyltransferase involved in cell wall biosynthesis